MSNTPVNGAASIVTIIDTGRGAIHVHRAGCADLHRAKYGPAPARWTLAGASRRDVVRQAFEGCPALQNDGGNWRALADAEDVQFFACCRLPDEPGEPARGTRAHRRDRARKAPR